MRAYYPKTRIESAESQSKAGRWHPSREVKWRGRWYLLSCGSSDYTSFFREDGRLYCLTINEQLRYAGLEEFHDGDSRDVFLQSEDAVVELVGPKGIDYAEATLANRLANCLDY